MNEAEFWKLIALVDRKALDAGDEPASVVALTDALAQLPVAEIESFHDHLAQALYGLDGESYAEHAGDAGGSDDSFLYARCYVVAHGKDHYAHVRAAPKKMPKSIDQWCESLLYVAPKAWSRQTGKDPAQWKFKTRVSYATGSNEAQWPEEA